MAESINFFDDLYSTKFWLLEPDLLLADRVIHARPGHVKLDCFGPFWAAFLSHCPYPGFESALRQGRLVPFSGWLGAFLPPFSIVEWHADPGEHHFQVLFSTRPLVSPFTTEPVAFSSDVEQIPRRVEDLDQWIRAAGEHHLIGRDERSSAIARRAKAWIDENYHHPMRLADMAQELRCPHATLTRAFQNCYGLTPVAYRAKVRVADSFRWMFKQETTVSASAHAAGFSDLSQFNKVFRREIRTSPSQFCRLRDMRVSKPLHPLRRAAPQENDQKNP